jgi:hypothetical protein
LPEEVELNEMSAKMTGGRGVVLKLKDLEDGGASHTGFKTIVVITQAVKEDLLEVRFRRKLLISMTKLSNVRKRHAGNDGE